jgi:hypothetical protein
MLPVSIFLCLVPNVTRFYLSVSCAQCYACLSFCVFRPMLHVSISLCLVPNVSCVYHSVSMGTRHRQIDTGNFGHKTQKVKHGYHLRTKKGRIDTGNNGLSFFVMCPMLPVSIFLCLVPNVIRVYLCVSCGKIDTGNIGHKTQKDRHG